MGADLVNSNKVEKGTDATLARISASAPLSQYMNIRVTSSLGDYTLIVGVNSIRLWDNGTSTTIRTMNWDA